MEFIKRLFENKKNLAIIGIIVAAIALPIIINQVLRQQDTRQGATGAPSINLNFTPHEKNVAVNETFEISLNLNAPQNDIGGIHFIMTYDPALLDINDATQPTDLKIIQKTNANGKFEATLINPNNTPVTGNGLVIITFQAKAKKDGQATVKLQQDIQATTSGYDTNTPIDLPDNIFATYTIGTNVSPTVDVCVAPTGLWPNGCSCTRDDQCANRKCSPTEPNGAGFCTDYLSPTPPVTVVPTIPTGCIRVDNGSVICPTPSTIAPTATPVPTVIPTAIPTAAPTATSAPTATIVPGDTTVILFATLQGIGKNTALGLNPSPIRPQRPGTAKFVDSQGVESKTVQVTFSYDPEFGYYKAIVSLGTGFTSGSYTTKIRLDNTLFDQVPIIINIQTGQQKVGPPPSNLISGDMNKDNSLTIQDYNNYMMCFRGLSSCTSEMKLLADFNDDGIVEGDLKDNNIIQYGFANQSGD